MGAQQCQRMRESDRTGVAVTASLDHTTGTEAACWNHLDLFDQMVGQRTRKAVRVEAAAVCDGCALKEMCAARVQA